VASVSLTVVAGLQGWHRLLRLRRRPKGERGGYEAERSKGHQPETVGFGVDRTSAARRVNRAMGEVGVHRGSLSLGRG
jgi:hypothetical protein